MPSKPQVSLNEAIEQATGVPTPPNAIPIPVEKPKRPRSKPGQRSLFVSLSQAHHARLEASADGRPVGLWLSKLIERNFETLVPKED